MISQIAQIIFLHPKLVPLGSILNLENDTIIHLVVQARNY